MAKSHIHWYQIPDTPSRNVAEATTTAWSDDVPVPKACMIIIATPNRRGIKKSLSPRTLRTVQTPSAVTLSRYATITTTSIHCMPAIMARSVLGATEASRRKS